MRLKTGVREPLLLDPSSSSVMEPLEAREEDLWPNVSDE